MRPLQYDRVVTSDLARGGSLLAALLFASSEARPFVLSPRKPALDEPPDADDKDENEDEDEDEDDDPEASLDDYDLHDYPL